MRKIKLTKGKYALVDDEDFDYLNQFKWSLNAQKYAGRYEKNKYIYMHRFLNKTPDGMVTDHINRNTLDNRKENLRTATKSLNALNTGESVKNTSGCTGVYRLKNNRWYARITINKKTISLGGFSSFKEAVRVRRNAEINLTCI